MIRATSLMLVSSLIAACATGTISDDRVPEGWSVVARRDHGGYDLVRAPSVIEVPAPGADQVTLDSLASPETASVWISENVVGSVMPTNVTVARIRRHDGLSWVDLSWSAIDGRSTEMLRLAWFESRGTTRTFRLRASKADWNASDLTVFHQFVRAERRRLE